MRANEMKKPEQEKLPLIKKFNQKISNAGAETEIICEIRTVSLVQGYRQPCYRLFRMNESCSNYTISGLEIGIKCKYIFIPPKRIQYDKV